jgi:hypothetical protein
MQSGRQLPKFGGRACLHLQNTANTAGIWVGPIETMQGKKENSTIINDITSVFRPTGIIISCVLVLK